MKKIVIVAPSERKASLLDGVRDLGLVHVSEMAAPDSALSAELNDLNRVRTVLHPVKLVRFVREIVSAGRLTCRKIFNIADDEQAILDAVGVHVGAGTTGNFKSIEVAETNGSPCVFAITFDRVNSMTYWVVLGGTEYETWENNDAPTPLAPNLTVTDKHGHIWEFGYIGVPLAGGASIRNRYLFEYQSDEYQSLQ